MHSIRYKLVQVLEDVVGRDLHALDGGALERAGLGRHRRHHLLRLGLVHA